MEEQKASAAVRGGQDDAGGMHPVFIALQRDSTERGELEGVDVFFTTDDKLIRRARRHADQIRVPIKNPLSWIIEETDS